MPKQKHFYKNQLEEQQFKALIENAHEGIVLYDIKGKIKYASRSVSKLCGYKAHEVLGRAGTDFIHADDTEEAREAFLLLQNKPGKSITLIQRIKHKKGGYIWAESLLTNFFHIPEINGIVSNFRDITEKRQAEENVKQSQTLFETISRNLSEGIFMGILGTRFLYANDAFIKMAGFKSLEALQLVKPAKLFADPVQQKLLLKSLKKKLALKDVETTLRKKNGDTLQCLLNVSLLKHEGKDNYFVGTLRDVSKEKEAAKQNLESRNFLNNIINTVAAPLYVKDEDHRWIMFNEKFSALLDIPSKKILGKTDKDLLLKKEAAIFWKMDNDVLLSGNTTTNEEVITSRKGKIHALLTVRSRYINERGEKFVIGSITDITHRKNAEDRIKQLHANLEGVLESAKESIFAVDNNLCYTAFNHHHKRIMKLLNGANIEIGKPKIEYIKNKTDSKWVKAELLKALEGRQFVTEHYQDYEMYKGYIQTTYNPIRDEKNKVKGVAVFVQDITDRKRFEEIVKSINANLRAVMESTSDRILAIDKNHQYITFNRAHADAMQQLLKREIRTGDNVLKGLPKEISKIIKKEINEALEGHQFTAELDIPKEHAAETSYNPIYNDKGNITGVALFIRDTTERKKMEERLRLLNHELLNQNAQLAAQEEELKTTLEELSERNFELDQLMYKTSHDLRSPLSSIMGLINLANIDEANVKQYLSKIEGRVKRLDEFIRSMLDYARVNRVEVEREAIDLESIARKCIHELEYLENFKKVKTHITVKNNYHSFESDLLRLEIIFSNIISNAYKYYNAEVNSFLKISIEYTATGAVVLFKDNGIGIKAEYMDKIFNMFFRATDRSQGSGLGMYIVKQAVEKLNGNITMESNYGVGTTIKIILPSK